MFRKSIVGFALIVAIVAGTFAMISPSAEAIAINKVTMQSQKVIQVMPGGFQNPIVVPTTSTRTYDSRMEYRSGDVVTHYNSATMKALLPQVLPQRVFTPKVKVNSVQFKR